MAFSPGINGGTFKCSVALEHREAYSIECSEQEKPPPALPGVASSLSIRWVQKRAGSYVSLRPIGICYRNVFPVKQAAICAPSGMAGMAPWAVVVRAPAALP